MDDELDARLARISPSTDVDELLDVGCDLADAGRLHDAERCFATAADLGSPTAAFNLGNTLGQLGRSVEAVTAYERALAGGETDAWLNLGNVLQDLGDLAGAMHAYREAAAAGDVSGRVGLAFCLWEQGERLEAMAVARGGRREWQRASAGRGRLLGVVQHPGPVARTGAPRGCRALPLGTGRPRRPAGDALAERALRDLLAP